MNYLAEYAAPPAADRFERATLAELRAIRDSLAGDPKPEWGAEP